MTTVTWGKCSDDKWCPFWTLNIEHEVFDDLEGVYLIWDVTSDKALYTGQGIIRDRIIAHRNESIFAPYKNSDVRVTWAQVKATSQDGVERFLFNSFSPKLSTVSPDVTPIEVNLPGK